MRWVAEVRIGSRECDEGRQNMLKTVFSSSPRAFVSAAHPSSRLRGCPAVGLGPGYLTRLCLAAALCWVWCAVALAAPPDTTSATLAKSDNRKRVGIRPIEPLTPKDQEAANALFPESYGVFVGIDKFEDSSIMPLECAKNDATELHKLFVEEMEFIPKKNARLLISGASGENAPTRTNIMAAIKDAAQRAGEKGSIVVQLSTHGIEGYIVPEDTRRTLLTETAVEMKWVKEQLEKSRCPRRILFYDACREALDRDSKAVAGNSDAVRNKFIMEMMKAKGLITLMSCSENQFSYEMKDKKHGAFTYYILKGLREGQVKPNDKGYITIQGLNEYVRLQVEEWSKNKPSGKQSPTLNLADSTGDLPLAMSGDFVAEELLKRMNEANMQLFAKVNNKQITQGCYETLTRALKSPEPVTRQVVFDFLEGTIPANYAERLLKDAKKVEPGEDVEIGDKSGGGEVTGENRFVALEGSLVLDKREKITWYCPPASATYTYGEACNLLEHELPSQLSASGSARKFVCVMPTEEQTLSLNKDYEYAVKALGIAAREIPSFWVAGGGASGFIGRTARIARFETARVSILKTARSEKNRVLVVCTTPLAKEPGR